MPLRKLIREKIKVALRKIILINKTIKSFHEDYEFKIKTYDELRKLDISNLDAEFDKILERSIAAANYSRQRKIGHEEFTKSKPKWYILNPNTRTRGVWECILLINLLYILFTMPKEYVFPYDPSIEDITYKSIQIWIEVVFIVDVFLHFFTSFIQDGIEVIDLPRIRLHYLKTDFLFDVICAFPLDWIFLAIGMTNSSNIGSAKQIVRLIRIINIPRKLTALFIKFNIDPLTVKSMLTSLTLFYAIHLVGCGYWYITTLEYNGFSPCGQVKKQCWVNYCVCDMNQQTPYILNSTDLTWYTPLAPDLWVPTPYSSLYTTEHQYISSFFWAVSAITSVGVNIVPKSMNEYIYSSIVIILGVVFYGIIIANITTIMSSFNIEETEKIAELDRLRNYLRKNKVHPAYYEFLVNYIQETWENDDPSENSIVAKLVPAGFSELLKKLVWKNIIHHYPLLKLIDIHSYYYLISNLKRKIFLEGDMISRKNQIADDLYLVYSGKVDAVANDDETVFYTIYPGEHFGEGCLLQQGIIRREVSFRAVTTVNVHIVSRVCYNNIITQCPELYLFILELFKQRMEKVNVYDTRGHIAIRTITNTQVPVRKKIFQLRTRIHPLNLTAKEEYVNDFHEEEIPEIIEAMED